MFKFTVAILIGSSVLLACKSAPKIDGAIVHKTQKAVEGGNKVPIDSAASRVFWLGTKVNGKHNGSFSIKSGEFLLDNGNLVGGKFVIDIPSLYVIDLNGEEKTKLEGHMKSADFFDAARFPEAVFSITQVAAFDFAKGKSDLTGATHVISGNLQLRDSTVNISFPAKISIDGNTVNALADFNIDRTRWGMNYKGPDNPLDFLIRKDVNLKLNVVSAK